MTLQHWLVETLLLASTWLITGDDEGVMTELLSMNIHKPSFSFLPPPLLLACLLQDPTITVHLTLVSKGAKLSNV